MAGDSGDIEQYRALNSRKQQISDNSTPFSKQYSQQLEKEYKGLSRSEIDAKVKSQSAHVVGRYVKELPNGQKIRAVVRNRDIEHFVNDALYKTGGKC